MKIADTSFTISFPQNQFSTKYTNFEEWKGAGKSIGQFFAILTPQILIYKNMSALFLETIVFWDMGNLKRRGCILTLQ